MNWWEDESWRFKLSLWVARHLLLPQGGLMSPHQARNSQQKIWMSMHTTELADSSELTVFWKSFTPRSTAMTPLTSARRSGWTRQVNFFTNFTTDQYFYLWTTHLLSLILVRKTFVIFSITWFQSKILKFHSHVFSVPSLSLLILSASSVGGVSVTNWAHSIGQFTPAVLIPTIIGLIVLQ